MENANLQDAKRIYLAPFTIIFSFHVASLGAVQNIAFLRAIFERYSIAGKSYNRPPAGNSLGA